MKRYGILALLLALCLLLPGLAGAEEGDKFAEPRAGVSELPSLDGDLDRSREMPGKEKSREKFKVGGTSSPAATTQAEPEDFTVTLQDVSLVYDGQEQDLASGIADADLLTEEQLSAITYAVVPLVDGSAAYFPLSGQFAPAESAQTRPKNVGAYRVFVRSSDDKCVFRRMPDAEASAEGDKAPKARESAPVPTPKAKAAPLPTEAYYDLTIEKAKLTFDLEAARDGDIPAYDPNDPDKPQSLSAGVGLAGVAEGSEELLCAELGLDDPEELRARLDAELEACPKLAASGSLAGLYPADNADEALAAAQRIIQQKLGENFDVCAQWKAGTPELELRPLEATVILDVAGGKSSAVYHEGVVLRFSDTPESISSSDPDAPVDSELKKSINIGNNELRKAGVLSSAEVTILPRNGKLDSNYLLTPEQGKKLVMFRQSIDDRDARWSDTSDEDLDAAYYDGIAVGLEEAGSTYDGSEKAIQTLVYDAKALDGRGYMLVEGEDYSVRILDADGEECSKVIDAGRYRVILTGVGNYGGTVELNYEVTKKSFDEDRATLTIENSEYDGKAHGLDPETVGADRVVYRRLDADGKGEELSSAPSAVGRYSAQAIWEGDTNSEPGRSNEAIYEITPLRLRIEVDAEGEIERMLRQSRDGAEVIDEATAELIREELLLDGDSILTEEQLRGDYPWPENFDVTVAPFEPEIRFPDGDTWAYDGARAGGEEHEIQTIPALIPGTENLIFYKVTEDGAQEACDGDDAAGPKDAGHYQVAIRRNWVGGETRELSRTDFYIEPLEVKLSIAPKAATISFGDELPGVDIQIEAAEGGATISEALRAEILSEWSVESDYGGSAGSYRYSLRALEQSGNFEYGDAVIEAPFEVAQQQIPVEGVEVKGASAEKVLDEASQIGEVLNTRAVITVRNRSGEVLERGRDYEFYALNAPGDSAKNELLVVGMGNYTGIIRLSWAKSFAQRLLVDGGFWLALALVLLLGAVGCTVAAVRLSGRIRQDSLKLLDKVSRQSRRTIRRGK